MALSLVELVNGIAGGVKYSFPAFLDALRVLNPANAGSVFKNLKPSNVGYVLVYLFIAAIPLFTGYFLNPSGSAEYEYSFVVTLKLALIYFAVAFTVPAVMSYILYLFDVRLVRAKVTHAEAITFISYAVTPALLSGIFKALTETWSLHLIALCYSIYLLYSALDARYGEDNALLSFIFLMMVGLFTGSLVFVILKTVLMVPGAYY